MNILTKIKIVIGIILIVVIGILVYENSKLKESVSTYDNNFK